MSSRALFYVFSVLQDKQILQTTIGASVVDHLQKLYYKGRVTVFLSRYCTPSFKQYYCRAL